MLIFKVLKLIKRVKRQKINFIEDYQGKHQWKVEFKTKDVETIKLLRECLGSCLQQAERTTNGKNNKKRY